MRFTPRAVVAEKAALVDAAWTAVMEGMAAPAVTAAQAANVISPGVGGKVAMAETVVMAETAA
ncbi:hypothetical protein [Mesorhizobium sp. B3-1-6]|uniref:hypothetical protein n=1 Tax=Mesorhizobium sp. B3-1-6 TaxID=2589895 RepID=UPI0015E395C4|nr:hypothetical protein [Mesorhizobium sp. B3-1-6]